MSVAIHLFMGDFDVRNRDMVSIIYLLGASDKTPLLIINNTTKEYWAYDFGCDFTRKEDFDKFEVWLAEQEGEYLDNLYRLEHLLDDEPSLKFE